MTTSINTFISEVSPKYDKGHYCKQVNKMHNQTDCSQLPGKYSFDNFNKML